MISRKSCNLDEAKNELGKAALKGTLEEMSRVLKRGANPNAKHFSRSSQLSATPLWWSTWDIDRVRLLLKYGADPSIVDTKYKSLPVEQAATLGHTPALVLLEALELLRLQQIERDDALTLLEQFTETQLTDFQTGKACVAQIHNQLILQATKALKQSTSNAQKHIEQVIKFNSLSKAEAVLIVRLANETLKHGNEQIIDHLLEAHIDKTLLRILRKNALAIGSTIPAGIELRATSIAWRTHRGIQEWRQSQEHMNSTPTLPRANTLARNSSSAFTKKTPTPFHTTTDVFLPMSARGLAAQQTSLLRDITNTWMECTELPEYVIVVLRKFFGKELWQKWIAREIKKAALGGVEELLAVIEAQKIDVKEIHRSSMVEIAKEGAFYEFAMFARLIANAVHMHAQTRGCRQASTDLLFVYARAVKVFPQFTQFVYRISSKCSGKIGGTRVKSLCDAAIAVGLTEPSKQWNAEHLLDIVQGIVTFDNMAHMTKFLNILVGLDKDLEIPGKRQQVELEELRIVNVVDRIETDMFGDVVSSVFVVHFYFALDANKHICELHLAHSSTDVSIKETRKLEELNTAFGLLQAINHKQAAVAPPTTTTTTASSSPKASEPTHAPTLSRRGPQIVDSDDESQPHTNPTPTAKTTPPTSEELASVSNKSTPDAPMPWSKPKAKKEITPDAAPRKRRGSRVSASEPDWKAAYDALRGEIEDLKAVVAELRRRLDERDVVA